MPSSHPDVHFVVLAKLKKGVRTPIDPPMITAHRPDIEDAIYRVERFDGRRVSSDDEARIKNCSSCLRYSKPGEFT